MLRVVYALLHSTQGLAKVAPWLQFIITSSEEEATEATLQAKSSCTAGGDEAVGSEWERAPSLTFHQMLNLWAQMMTGDGAGSEAPALLIEACQGESEFSGFSTNVVFAVP